MESDVAYVRHVDDGSTLTDSSVFDQRYSAHQAISPGYREYGVEPEVNLDHDEEFVPPPSVEPKADFASSALQVVACYWIGLFGPLVVLFVGNKTLYVQHHAYQGLFVTTALWIICAAFIWQWIALLVLCLFSLICFTALTLKALSDYNTGHCFKLPVLGGFCYRMAQKAVATSRIK